METDEFSDSVPGDSVQKSDRSDVVSAKETSRSKPRYVQPPRPSRSQPLPMPFERGLLTPRVQRPEHSDQFVWTRTPGDKIDHNRNSLHVEPLVPTESKKNTEWHASGEAQEEAR